MADESECLVGKSPLNSGQMPYTDGVNSTASSTSTVSPAAHSFQPAQATTTHHHGGHNTTTANSYDINDDIILSQFHADAIKQARLLT